jgi:hypothetical protein
MQPVIPELRTIFGNPDFLKNLEGLVKRIPDIDAKLDQMRERMKKFAAMREQRANAATT